MSRPGAGARRRNGGDRGQPRDREVRAVRHQGPAAGGYLFADCGLIPEPDETDLVAIAAATARSAGALLETEPRVAFLSFSTRGSAEHPRVDKVRAAVAHARARRPDLHLDGEMQVVVVEDVVSTGLSSRECIDAVKKTGAKVLALAALIDRSGGAAKFDVPFIPLARMSIL